MTYKVLIVEDDQETLDDLSELLSIKGFTTIQSLTARESVTRLKTSSPDVIILDLVLPDMDGIDLLAEMNRIAPHVPIIILTCFGDIPTAVKATKLGAYDFLIKPPELEKIIHTIHRAIESSEMRTKIRRLDSMVDASLENTLGRSKAMREVIEAIKKVAQTNLSIVLQGETGVGKTTIARLIHGLSRRGEKPFVKVDVGSLSESLIESELFGYDKGAFTGAERRKKGFFEMADGGTILLDDIEEISSKVQSKLLTVVEEKVVFLLGGNDAIDIDIRIITATNRDLKVCIAEKKLREDLFYRLGEFIITIPPLRERKEDIVFYTQKLLIEVSDELNIEIQGVNDEVKDIFMNHSWPGNIRELKNVLKRAALYANGSAITPEHIVIFNEASNKADHRVLSLKESLKDKEKESLKSALQAAGGDKYKAASMLGISYRSLQMKVREYGIRENRKS